MIEEEEYVRVFRPMENRVEIWRKIRKDKGDWLIEFTGSVYPMTEERNDDKEETRHKGQ